MCVGVGGGGPIGKEGVYICIGQAVMGKGYWGYHGQVCLYFQERS